MDRVYHRTSQEKKGTLPVPFFKRNESMSPPIMEKDGMTNVSKEGYKSNAFMFKNESINYPDGLESTGCPRAPSIGHRENFDSTQNL